MRTLPTGVILVFAACGGSGGTEPPGPATVDLTAAATALVSGETVQLAWTVKDGQGAVLPGVTVSFTASPTSVATVSLAGVVTGVAPGNVTITARAGNATDQVQLLVQHGGIVAATGGTVSGYTGNIEVVVPAGAVAAPTAVRFSTVSNPVLDPTAAAGSIYDVHFGSAPSAPVTLRIRFSTTGGPFGLPAGDYGLRRFTNTEWVGIAGSAADGGTLVASAPISASGTYSAGWVPPGNGCGPEARQFDFWIGAWNVSGPGGQVFAQSDITLAPGGCAVLEHYRDNGGTVGRSISVYQPATAKWYQTYMDNRNFRLLISGTAQNPGMTLFTEPAGNAIQRWTWTVEGNNVRQVAAESNNGGGTYGAPSFNGLYVPR